MAPYSGTERKVVHMNSRICTEYAQAIRRCFEHVILTSLYPRSTISIHCTIFQADGGELSCCLNAALLAVIDAGIDILDFQVSLSVGYMDNTILFGRSGFGFVTSRHELRGEPPQRDLADRGVPAQVGRVHADDAEQQHSAGALPGRGTARRVRWQDVLDAAKEGCKQVYAILKDHVLENAKKLYQSTQQCPV